MIGYILAFSVLLQFAAAIMALRLIRLTGERIAWGIIATATVLMAVRRLLSLLHLTQDTLPFDTTSEILAAVISLLVVVGISRIAPLFSAIRKAETTLGKQLGFTETLLRTIPLAVFYKDAEGRYLGCNEEFSRLMGVTAEEIAGKTAADLWPGELSQAHPLHDKDLTANHQPQECKLHSRQGMILDVLYHKNVLRDGKGTVLGIIGAFLDITKRKRAEEALLASEGKYRLMVDTATEGILALGPDGLITFVNARMTEMTGYSNDEIIGRPFSAIIFEQDLPDHLQRMERRRLGLSETYERRFRCKDGQTVWTIASAAPLFDEEGQFAGSFGMFADISERKRAEDALRASEAKHRIVADNTYDWEFWLSPEGEFLYISPSCKRITGYAPEQFLADPELMKRIIHPDDQSRFTEHQHKAKHMNPGMIEYRIIRPDGGIRWLEHACQPVFDEKGNFLGTRGSNRDSTDRRQAEQALRDEKRNAESLLRLSRNLERAQTHAEILAAAREEVRTVTGYRNLCVYLFTEDKKYAHSLVAGGETADLVMPEAETDMLEISGHRMLEAIAEAHDIVVVADSRTDERTDKETVARLGIRTSVNVPIVLSDKRMGWVGTGTFGEEGVRVPTTSEMEYLRALASHMAVSLDRVHLLERRQKAEAHLARSNAFIKNILESVDEGFIVIDRDFRILSANHAYLRLCGRDDKDVVGKHCHEIAYHLDKPCHECGEECPAQKAFRSGESHASLRRQTAGGKTVYLETKAYPMEDEKGNVESVIETMVDITERLKLEEQLHHAQKMEAIGTLAGGVAHDFNNILTAIIGYGDLMKMKMAPGDAQIPFLDQILLSAKRAANLTQALLAFSRKQAIAPKPVDLNDTVRNIEKLLRRLIGEDIEFTTQLRAKKLIAMADPSQIEQVLMNLATNARDAMPGGGRLVLTADELDVKADLIAAHGLEKPGRYALLTVSDTGQGMDEQTREKIFEPFFTTKVVGQGTGLGLSIVYGIIKQHNGHINCYSEMGNGTTFKVYIPLISLNMDEMRAVPQPQPRGGTETILFAEDDDDVRHLAISHLTSFGYHVIAAADGQEAIDTFKKHEKEINLVVLDVIMPKRSGKEVYDVVKATRPELEVLFISGYTADIIHKKGIFDEGLQFMSKPVRSMDLLRKVRELLDGNNDGSEYSSSDNATGA